MYRKFSFDRLKTDQSIWTAKAVSAWSLQYVHFTIRNLIDGQRKFLNEFGERLFDLTLEYFDSTGVWSFVSSSEYIITGNFRESDFRQCFETQNFEDKSVRDREKRGKKSEVNIRQWTKNTTYFLRLIDSWRFQDETCFSLIFFFNVPNAFLMFYNFCLYHWLRNIGWSWSCNCEMCRWKLN